MNKVIKDLYLTLLNKEYGWRHCKVNSQYPELIMETADGKELGFRIKYLFKTDELQILAIKFSDREGYETSCLKRYFIEENFEKHC